MSILSNTAPTRDRAVDNAAVEAVSAVMIASPPPRRFRTSTWFEAAAFVIKGAAKVDGPLIADATGNKDDTARSRMLIGA